MRSVTVHSLMRVANRLQGLAQSEIRRMTRECERVGGINLGQGICDLPTPPLVRDGAIAAIRENRSTYSFAEGARELRDAIARKLARDNGLQADPATEICVTVGASGAYTAAIHALLDAGDGILLFEPYYGYHLNAAVVAGLTPEFATLRPPEVTLREDALDQPGERSVLRLRAHSLATRRRQGIRRASQLLRRIAVGLPAQARPHLRGAAARGARADRSGGRVLRSRRLRQARLQDVSAGGDARARDHRGGLGARQRILPGRGRRETAAILLRQGRRSARPGVREARGP